MDVKEMGWEHVNWIRLAQSKDQWRIAVASDFKKLTAFLEYLRTVHLSRTLLCGYRDKLDT